MAAATGWSVSYILWGIPYQTLIMALQDAPRYVNKKAGEERSAEEEADTVAREMEGFFQSF